MGQDERIKKLVRIYWLSSYLVFWVAIEALLIIVGVVNLAFAGLDNLTGQVQLLIGASMVMGHIFWVRKVCAFLDQKPVDYPSEQ